MTLKILGAILVIVSCGGFGFAICAKERAEALCLKNFITAIEYLACELRYRNTPLPQLCRSTAAVSNGAIRKVFYALADEMDKHISPNVENCMKLVLRSLPDLPERMYKAMAVLGRSLGKFDLEGQLQGIAAAVEELKLELKNYTEGQNTRMRCYQTLGLCAGAAIAILVI